jgi:thiol-disulfide isomerase/thioredoxin
MISAVVLGGCGAAADVAPAATELPAIDVASYNLLVQHSDQPMVVNFWASWCVPCRSEAPLLAAADLAEDRIRFIGIASEDTAADAAAFIAEFGIEFENFFDRPGAVRGAVGGPGLPMTLFVAAGGEVVQRHFGIIDDAALALGIDELLNR